LARLHFTVDFRLKHCWAKRVARGEIVNGGENWVKSSARAIAYYYDHAAEIEAEVQANSEPAAKFVNRLV
jgi:hypothetical protein